MKKSPKLIKISEAVYGCSECADFKIEIAKPSAKTPVQWETWTGQQFLDHFRRRHSDEDVSQSAAGSNCTTTK